MNAAFLAALFAGTAVLLVFAGIIGVGATSKRTMSRTPRRSGNLLDGVQEGAREWLLARINRSEVDRLLDESGNPKNWDDAAIVREGIQNGLVIALLPVIVFPVLLIVLGLPWWAGLIIGLAIAPLAFMYGYGAPMRTLKTISKQRIADATVQIPSFLTTASSLIRSGATVRNAVAEATTELPEGTLRGELDLVNNNISAGASFANGLLGLRDRLPSSLVDEMCLKLTDSASTGVSAADSLYRLALKAMEDAAAVRRAKIQQAKLNILVITVVLLAPATGVVLMYPIITSTLDALGGVGG